MTAKQALKKARKLLSDPKKWNEGRLSYEGTYCALGAIKHSLGASDNCMEYGGADTRHPKAYKDAVKHLACVIDSGCGNIGVNQAECIIFPYNDDMGYDCTIAAFDAAIEKCPDE